MLELLRREGPFAHRNVRLYTWFSVLYNARAYYPVMAILFLALGLSVRQFFLLNMVWAAAIFLLVVPSGAIADTVGRKRLVVLAAALMVAEMALLLFAPQNGGWVLFTMCLLNRLLSGASEASASGADQALAFDTLVEHGKQDQWDDVLATAMRWRSIGFFLAMMIGALVYDPRALNWLLQSDLEQATTLRIPLAIVFVQSILCLGITLRMREPKRENPCEGTAGERCLSAAKLTLRTAAWVVNTPLALRIVLGGVLIDAVLRNFVTINSEYYRLIKLPEYSFGFIGAATAALGFFTPVLARMAVKKFTPMTNLALLAGVMFVGFLAVVPAVPYAGVLPVMILISGFGWLEFITSSTLNRIADSSQRATVLSVKGLAYNLGYGGLALAYAGVLGAFEEQTGSSGAALLKGLPWQAAWFAATLVLFFVIFGRPPRSQPAAPEPAPEPDPS
ncbi:MAG: MFS transporter [Akkermansiaceae bacterium]|nr:MFS transporter [Akkermansiaceae bacterium]